MRSRAALAQVAGLAPRRAEVPRGRKPLGPDNIAGTPGDSQRRPTPCSASPGPQNRDPPRQARRPLPGPHLLAPPGMLAPQAEAFTGGRRGKGRQAWGRSSVSAATSGCGGPRSPHPPFLPLQEIPGSQSADSASGKRPLCAGPLAAPRAAGAGNTGGGMGLQGGLLPLWAAGGLHDPLQDPWE